MKQIDSKIISQAQKNLTTANPNQQPGTEHDAKFINELFRDILANKPGWRAAFAGREPEQINEALKAIKIQWMKAFIEAGVSSQEQIAIGMKKLRADPKPFLPNAGQFIEWCKPNPEDYGLPDKHMAWNEAATNSKVAQRRTHKWSHPAVYKAASIVGWMEMSQASNQGPEKEEFAKAYQSVCERVMNGEAVSVPEVTESALEHHDNGEKLTTEQEAEAERKNKSAGRAALDELKGKF